MYSVLAIVAIGVTFLCTVKVLHYGHLGTNHKCADYSSLQVNLYDKALSETIATYVCNYVGYQGLRALATGPAGYLLARQYISQDKNKILLHKKQVMNKC